jgi:purine-binding chemotaxis protein CheW
MAELYCTAWLDELLLAVAIDRVVEVLPQLSIAPVPLAHPAVAGLINVRGQIMTVVDARRLLGRPGPPSETSTIVVVRTADEALGLMVDRAGDVVEADDLPGKGLVVLDPDQAFDLTTEEETMRACSADR